MNLPAAQGSGQGADLVAVLQVGESLQEHLDVVAAERADDQAVVAAMDA